MADDDCRAGAEVRRFAGVGIIIWPHGHGPARCEGQALGRSQGVEAARRLFGRVDVDRKPRSTRLRTWHADTCDAQCQASFARAETRACGAQLSGHNGQSYLIAVAGGIHPGELGWHHMLTNAGSAFAPPLCLVSGQNQRSLFACRVVFLVQHVSRAGGLRTDT